MICPKCKKAGVRVHKNDKVHCSFCDFILEESSELQKKVLSCPLCKEFSINDYCSHCGYTFQAGKDY